jgi:hypothetical protein
LERVVRLSLISGGRESTIVEAIAAAAMKLLGMPDRVARLDRLAAA